MGSAITAPTPPRVAPVLPRSPTAASLDLMRRCAARLEKEKYWDQTVYNEELFFMSHGDYVSPRATVRVMEIDVFMNSKRLFKTVRHLPRSQQPKPAMIHMNYHPGDRTETDVRLKCGQ